MPGSALIGQPPSTDNDFYIVKALLREFHSDRDPTKGASFGPLPPNMFDHSRGPRILAGSIVLIVLTVLITGSRLLIRGLHHQLRWGWDDWFIIPASLCTIGWSIVSIVVAMSGGAGRHIWFLTYQEYNIYRKMGAIALMFFIPSTVFVKITVALFVRRMTKFTTKTWVWINDIFLALLAIELLFFSFYDSLLCNPIAGRFDLIVAGKSEKPMTCRPRFIAGEARVYSNIILDFCLLSTPIFILWKVQMPFKKKLRIYGLFGLGSVACVGSVMSVIISLRKQPTLDYTYHFTDLFGWLLVDLLFGLLVASAPILYSQLPQSWRMISTGVRHRIGTHTDKSRSRSHRIPEDGSGRHETLDSGKIYRQDDIELEYTVKPTTLDDAESGKKGLLEDQHPWADQSIQVPDRMYHHATSGIRKSTDPPLHEFRSEKGSIG